jgi:hypothetical protein
VVRCVNGEGGSLGGVQRDALHAVPLARQYFRHFRYNWVHIRHELRDAHAHIAHCASKVGKIP